MSGLTFLVNFDGAPVDEQWVDAMTEPVAFRGPHGKNSHFSGNAGFAFLALHATLESHHEHQPLVFEDAGLTLLSDSRIDNREELLRVLSVKPASGTVITDADLVLAAYLKWGEESPAYLIGDFAFLIWNDREQRVFAARDPMGVRSLHYARFGKSFCITSEAQQILYHPKASNRLRDEAMVDWLIGDVGQSGSMFEDAQMLPPGCCLQADVNGARVKRFWDLKSDQEIRYKRVEEYCEHLLEVLEQSVQARLRTDRDVIGSDLSGGLDSPTVTALAVRALQGQGTKLLPMSMQYPSTPSCDETGFIEDAAKHIGVEPVWIDAEEHGALGYPKQHVHSLESPWVRHYPIMDFEMQQLQAAGANVLLTGTGGDEVATGGMQVYFHRFWNGDWKTLKEVWQFCRIYRRSLAKISYKVFLEPGLSDRWDSLIRRATLRKTYSRHSEPPAWLTPRAVELLQRSRANDTSPGGRWKHRAWHYRYDDLFRGVLPASIGTFDYVGSPRGIEVRHPFLDRRLIEFCYSIPLGLWSNDLFTKWLLRKATVGLLPDSIRWRPDKSIASEVFGKAIAANMDYVNEVLAADDLANAGLCSADALSDFFHSYFSQNHKLDRRDLDFSISLQCWLYTNHEFLRSNQTRN